MRYTNEQWTELAPHLKEKYRIELQSDFEFFCLEMLVIKAKDPDLVKSKKDSGKIIPFKWNEAQHMVWGVCCEMMALGLPIDIIILKARQLGISTFFLAFIFWRMWRENNVSAAIFAHQKDPTLLVLNETMAIFYEGMPPGLRPQLRQKTKDAKIGLEGVFFSDRLSTARFNVQGDSKGRGTTSDLNLFTEVSFYKNALEFFGSFMAAMTKGSQGLIVQESTAKDGYFKDAYFAAANGDAAQRRAIFIAWWKVPSLNSKKIEWRGRKNNIPADPFTHEKIEFENDEIDHMKMLTRLAKKEDCPPITFEQMYWRKDTIARAHNGEQDQFDQEHPWCPEVAFQLGSRSAFKPVMQTVLETSQKIYELAEKDIEVMGNLVSVDLQFSTAEPVIDPVVAWRPDTKGRVDQEHVYGMMRIEAPRKGLTYVLGADVAGEVNDDEDPGERAASVVSVLCLDTQEQVAEWRGHIDPWDFGTILAQIGFYYNGAMICLERNNMGVTTEDRLTNVLYYPNMYKWPDWNKGASALTNKTSWETNPKTKLIMMGNLTRFIRDGLFIVRSPRLATEMGSYVIKNGKYKTTDRPSDTIIAAALCVQAALQSKQNGLLMSGLVSPEHVSGSGAAARFMLQSNKDTKKGLVTAPPPRSLPMEFAGEGDSSPFYVKDTWGGFDF